MAVIYSDPITTVFNRRRHTVITMTQDATTLIGDELDIGVPEFGTLVMVESVLAGVAGAVTIQPAFGVIPAFVIGGDGYLDQASAAALVHKIQDKLGFVGRKIGTAAPRLYIRTLPNADLGAGQSIVTRITFTWGLDL